MTPRSFLRKDFSMDSLFKNFLTSLNSFQNLDSPDDIDYYELTEANSENCILIVIRTKGINLVHIKLMDTSHEAHKWFMDIDHEKLMILAEWASKKVINQWLIGDEIQLIVECWEGGNETHSIDMGFKSKYADVNFN